MEADSSVTKAGLAAIGMLALAACASSGGDGPAAAAQSETAAPANTRPSAAAAPAPASGTKPSSLCVDTERPGLGELRRLEELVLRCLGKAHSRHAEVARSHSAVFLLLEYSAGSIRDFGKEDPDQALADALVLRALVRRAVAKLKIAQDVLVAAESAGAAADADARTPTLATYREVTEMVEILAGKELFAVARIAVSLRVEEGKRAIKGYLTAASGGLLGVFRRIWDRRDDIEVKIDRVDRIRKKAQRGIHDTRCELQAIDIQQHVDGKSAYEKPKTDSNCRENYGSTGYYKRHWKDVNNAIDATFASIIPADV